MLLWAIPTITLIGDDPQRMTQDTPYDEAGATAVDVQGTDISGDVTIDSSGLDVAVPGSYQVLYDVVDSEGYTDHIEREVIVLDIHRPDVRLILFDLLKPGMPDGLQVYMSPAEQIKAPAVVVGTMSWTPDRMASLAYVEWEIEIHIFVTRSAPEYYGQFTLETLSLKTATLLLAAGFRVVGFSDEGMVNVGGTDYLSGTLAVIYKQTKEG